MFADSQSETNYQRFLAEWQENGADSSLKIFFLEIIRRLDSVPRMVFKFTAHDHAGNTLRALRPDLHRPLIALMEIPDDSPSPRSFSIRFYDDALRDPHELGDWIPRGLVGEDARSFTFEGNQPALADYLLDCLSGLLNRLPG